MSWAVGFNEDLQRDIGYGVPSWCDHPGCYEEIDRGLSYICGGFYYAEDGCGLAFCPKHQFFNEKTGKFCCQRCCEGREHFKPSLDTDEWIEHKMTDPSWAQWRKAEFGAMGQEKKK